MSGVKSDDVGVRGVNQFVRVRINALIQLQRTKNNLLSNAAEKLPVTDQVTVWLSTWN